MKLPPCKQSIIADPCRPARPGRKMAGGLHHAGMALLLFATATLGATSLAGNLTAEIRPQAVVVGEVGQLVLTANTAILEHVALPRVDGIEWLEGASRSSQTTIVKLKATHVFVVSYPFRATREGTFDIPAFPVEMRDGKALTPVLQVQAVKRQVVVGDDLLFMRASFPDGRTEFYLGEEIPCEVKVYSSPALTVEFPYPELAPSENGAEVIFRDCSSVNEYSRNFLRYEQGTERVGDELFTVYRCRGWLRPVSAGKLGGKVRLKATISLPEQRDRRGSRDPFFDSFFRGPFARYRKVVHDLEAALPEAVVKELPPPPPGVDFLGLVGEWEVKVDLAAANLHAGEPLTLRIKVAGQGTAETLTPPPLEAPGCRLFPPEIARPERKAYDQDRAEIRWAVIPLQAGPLPLQLRLATFSPKTGAYRLTEWRQNLSVAPGEKSPGVVVEHDDEPSAPVRPPRTRADGLLYLKRNPSDGVALPLWRHAWPALLSLLLLGPLAWGLSEGLAWRRRRFAADPVRRRQMAARGRRGRILRHLRQAGREAVATVVREEVVPYLNDRLAMPPGTGIAELAQRVDDPELAEALRDAEAGAYLPGAAASGELRERLLRGLTRLGAVVLCLLGPALTAATSADPAAANPFAAYDDGRFAEAAAAFSARLDPARPDPVLLYNLGNCRYQQGDLTGALVCFEQARRLAPRDTDIRENLNHVRRRLMLPEVGRGGHPLALIADLRDHLRPDQWLLLAAAAWAAVGVALAWRRRLPAHALMLTVGLFGLIALTCLAAVGIQCRHAYSPDAAVALERGAPVHVLPSVNARQAEYRLYPGEPVRIVEARDDGWRRIRGEGGEGWVRAAAVAPIWGHYRLETPPPPPQPRSSPAASALP